MKAVEVLVLVRGYQTASGSGSHRREKLTFEALIIVCPFI